MLLCHNVGQINNSIDVTVHADCVDFLKINKTLFPIHSHWLHSAEDIATRSCVFSLRKNPVDTVMSYALANHYKLFHVWRDQTVDLKSFVFEDWNHITHLCQRYCHWHTYYGLLLQPEHQIVYYEDYIKTLPNNPAYQRTFPEKMHLLKNYQQVHDYIARFAEAMLASQLPFAR
jgi:hypothetical protein